LKITDPVTRGLAIGASSHGLGTAAIKDEEDAFPFSAIAMAVVGTCTTVVASCGWGRKVLGKILM